MIEGLIARIEREAGVPNLLEVLERMAPADLQSLLLEVYSRSASTVSPRRLIEQYEQNRFVAPSAADPRMLVEADRLAWSLLPEGYTPLELSPLCPLGTNAAVASVNQNKVVSTIRNTEVVADSTNVLALECAIRRRRLIRIAGRAREHVLLAASQRLTRAQFFQGARLSAHFRVLSLCAAGRDEGSLRFESRHIVEQIAFYIRLVREAAQLGCRWRAIRVAVTDFTAGRLSATLEDQVLRPISNHFPDATCHLDPSRSAGRGYYDGVCFKFFATDRTDCELELGDGGVTQWTRHLLSDRKERLVISGLATERLCAA